MRARVTSVVGRWWSVLIGAACGVWWLVEVAVGAIPTGRGVAIIFAVAVCATFAASKWWPLQSALGVTVLFMLHGLVDVESLVHGVASGVIANATVCLFGSLARLRDRLVGLVVIEAAALSVYLRAPEDALDAVTRAQVTISNAILFAILWAASWLIAGRVRETRALRAHAARLETERDELARLAVAEERERIARELHDVVAHSVSVMTVQAGGVRRLLGDDQERERDALASIESTGRQALSEMRRLVGVMRTGDAGPDLAPQPGLAGLGRLVDDMRDAGLPVRLTIVGDAPELVGGVDLSAFRIVQEALTNTLKHAGPATATVELTHRPGTLEILVEDDGTGERGTGRRGHGLIGMRERVALFGGTLEVGNRPGGGFRVHAVLPVERTDGRVA